MIREISFVYKFKGFFEIADTYLSFRIESAMLS